MKANIVLVVFIIGVLLNQKLVNGQCLPDIVIITVTIPEDAPEGTIYKPFENVTVKPGASTTLVARGEGAQYIDPLIDENGKLIFKVKLSVHDIPDGDNAKDKLDMEIGCEGSADNQYTQVIITITPVNDHPPVFDSPLYTAEIQEMMAPGFVVPMKDIIVSDQDSHESGYLLTVTITEGDDSGVFDLKVEDITTTKVKKLKFGLITKKTVEMPDEGYYNLTLYATDNDGEKPLNSTSILIINVKPLDMRDPIFEHEIYKGELYFEENSNGDILVKNDQQATPVSIKTEPLNLTNIKPKAIFAYDQDIKINATLKYELIKSTETQDWASYFNLVGTQLSLVKVDEDFLKETSINLLIKASQEDDSTRIALALISLKIHLPESKRPYFTQRVEILRRTEPDKVVYNIEVEDGGDVNIKLEEVPNEGYFTLSGKSIKLNKPIPESVESLTLKINVEKKTSLTQTSNNVKVIFDVVTVKTIQDPLFEKKEYKLDIWKDLKLGEEIFQLIPLEKEVIYKNIKQSPDTGTFKFDLSNGKITLTKNPATVEYIISIEGQTSDSTDTTKIYINVIEPKPKPDALFKTQKQSVQIVSDHKINTELFKIDTNFPGKIDFDYADTTDESIKAIFQLDNKSGVLQLISPLENKEEEYTVFIRGSLVDGNNKREEINEVVIKVLKKIDPPTSLFKKSIYRFDIASDTSIGDELFKIDTIENTDISLKIESIKPNEGQGIFQLSTNGQITLSGALGDTTTDYKLMMVASIGKREEKAEVWIDVVTKMDPPNPIFKKSIYNLDLMSDTKKGTVVFDITTNTDDVKMEVKSFTPSNGGSIFTFSENGQLTLNDILPSETKQYKIVVTGHSNKRTEETEVVISIVEKLTPPSPLFDKQVYRVDVLSNTEIDTEILEVKTITGEVVTIEISTDTENSIKSLFRVENNKIFLNGKLNSGTKEYKLVLLGTSANLRTEKAEVFITVVEKLKPPTPLFAKSIYRTDILSDTQKDKELIELSTNTGKIVTLTITNVLPESAKSLFKLVQNKVVLDGVLEKGTKEYKILVEGSVDSQKETTEVIITIVDKLKPPNPLFTKSVYRTDILSDTQKDKELIELTTNTGKVVTLTITNVSPESAKSLFKLVQNKVVLDGVLEKGTKEYKILVEGSVDSEKETTEVIMTIVDKLKPPSPLFTKSIYRTDILSDTQKDKELIELATTTGKVVTLTITNVSPESAKTLFKLVQNKVVLDGVLEKGTKEYKILVEGSVDSEKETTEVVITIVDKLNPPSPLFTKSVYRTDILSDTQKDKELIELTTTTGKVVTLTITNVLPETAKSLFRLNQNKIVLGGKLESATKEYKIFVEGSVESQKETTEVIITIVDKLIPPNPLFAKSIYRVDILSDTEINKELLEIKTNEKDLTMKILDVSPESAKSLFRLDKNKLILNGIITKDPKEFKLTLEGSNALIKETAEVFITVVDKLIAPSPLFTKLVYIADIFSGSKIGKQLLEIETNPDKAVTIQITSVHPDSFASLFKLEGNKIILNGALPKEITAYKLIVVATAEPQTERTEVIFEVVSAEDCSLLDQSKAAHLVQVPEEKKIGDIVFQIKANEKASFKVVGGDSEYFTVNETTGEVSLKKELKSVYYNLTVLVESKETQEKTATAQLLFEVDLKRPLATLFKKDINQVDVPVDTTVGKAFYKLEIVKNSKFKVQLSVTGGKNKDGFEITNDDHLSLVNPIEADKEYEIEVTATVIEPEQLIDITKVVVYGVDVKRPLTPIFQKSEVNVDIIECTEKGTVIYTLPPTLIQDVTFHVKGGDIDIFEIDALKGEIKLKGNLKNNQEYFLDIEASKDELKDKTKNANITKTISFVSQPSVWWYKSQANGNSIMSHRCLKYYTEGDKSIFNIESNGEIKTLKLLELKEYEIKVKGTSQTDPVITDFIIVKFYVKTCVQEKTSLFTKPVFITEVNSSYIAGDKLELETIKPNEVTARYFLIEENDDFNLTENGQVILKTSPEQLQKSIYFLIIGGEEIETDKETYSSDLKLPDLKENQALIIIHNNILNVQSNCSKEDEKVSLFTKSVHNIEIDSFTPTNTVFNLNSMIPDGVSATYFLRTHTDKFSLNDGKLIITADPKSLALPYYFLAVRAAKSVAKQEINYYNDDSKIPDIEDDEALIIVHSFNSPSSPIVKVMLPNATLGEYVIDIKAISPKGQLKFSVNDNEYFGISETDGQLYPKQDVTKIETRHFKLTVTIKKDNLKSEFLLEIIRLKTDEVIVFNSEIVSSQDLPSLEKNLENATSLKMFLLEYEEIPNTQAYLYSNGEVKARYSVAAFDKTTDFRTPVTFETFKQKTTEQKDEITTAFGNYEQAKFDEIKYVYVHQHKDSDNGGLVAAVAMLSVVLGIVLISAIGFMYLRNHKPHILEKIRTKFQKDKSTAGSSEKRHSVEKFISTYSNSYENYGGDLTDSVRGSKTDGAFVGRNKIVKETNFELTNEVSTIPSVPREKETSNLQEETSTRFTQDSELGTTNPRVSYQNRLFMEDNNKPTGSDTTIPLPVEKEDQAKTESLLQVPVDHHQLPSQQNTDQVQEDYGSQAEASKPDVKPRIKGLPREDSFGLDVDDEEAKQMVLPELPEAFNNDLIDEEDVDTGEPGGTPHVHRKHIEIHVEEDISDEEEEEMIRKMAAIPQRKSVVTFSDKTEVIP